MPGPAPAPPAGRATPARHGLRFALGMAQIVGVGFSLGLLYSGLTAFSLGAVLGTCLLTAASLLLFGWRGGRS